MGNVLGTGDRADEMLDLQRAQHRSLFAVTQMLYNHLQKVRVGGFRCKGKGYLEVDLMWLGIKLRFA